MCGTPLATKGSYVNWQKWYLCSPQCRMKAVKDPSQLKKAKSWNQDSEVKSGWRRDDGVEGEDTFSKRNPSNPVYVLPQQ